MKKDIHEYLDSEEFFNLMQIYRHTPVRYPAEVIEAFENVKSFIIKMVKELK